MKKTLFALLAFLPCFANGAVPITEGNVKQESCGFPESQVGQSWKTDVPYPVSATVKNKLAPVGKVVSQGDALFYANIVTSKKSTYYKASSNIEIKGDSWANVDYSLRSGEILPEYGTFSSNDKKYRYQLLQLRKVDDFTFYVAVRDDGFICSGFIKRSHKDGYLITSSYSVYQKDPLIRQEQVTPNSDESIALILVSMDDISATLAVKLMEGGKVVRQKEIQLDAMSGTFKVGQQNYELAISFEKTGKSAIKIKSIKEPEDYSNWRNYIRFSLLGMQY